MSAPHHTSLQGRIVSDDPGGALDPLLQALADRLAPLLAERVSPLLIPAASPLLVDVEAAAKLLDVPTSWLAAEARRGTFRSYKHGHYRRYDPREVVEDFKRLAPGDA